MLSEIFMVRREAKARLVEDVLPSSTCSFIPFSPRTQFTFNNTVPKVAKAPQEESPVATINDQELAILCDIVSGWGVKKWAENPGATKRRSLDRLIALGYVEPVHAASTTTYQHTTKTDILFAQLCVGISGG
jgi:hypothetical protein